MKKALPWIIGIACILLLYAMTLAGWLWSILTIGINVGVLFGLYQMFYKSKEETVRNTARILAYVVMSLAVCLMLVGSILGILGLINPGGETYTSHTECGWCGGTGYVLDDYDLPKICGLCKGRGGADSEYTKTDEVMFPTGMLMAASGVVLFFGACAIKNDAPTPSAISTAPSRKPDIPFAPMTTAVGELTMMLGYWVDEDSGNRTWRSNEADENGRWTMRCRISNKGEKAIHDLVLTVSLYNDAGQAIVAHKTYHSAITIESGTIHSLWWDLPSCANTTLAKGMLESAKMQFSDGMVCCFTRS